MPPTNSEEPISVASAPAPRPVEYDGNLARKFRAIGIFAALLCLAFFKPLLGLIRFGLAEERNTYLLLVPAITIYLISVKRREIRADVHSSIGSALVAGILGAVALACSSTPADPIARLSLQIISLLCFLFAGFFFFLGHVVVKELAFPVGFLIFMAPLPAIFVDYIEIFLQYTSAEAAYWMLSITQVPMLRDGLDFLLPGIPIHVAQECSGYNSTFALFVVSTVAGYLFLKSPWRRTALSIAVIPLAILRNGFRITTIALLCVHVDPAMIHSFIHRQGGPIFFALSLIPFFLLLWWMRKLELGKARKRARI